MTQPTSGQLGPPPILPKVPLVAAALMPYHRQAEAFLHHIAQWINTGTRLPTATANVAKRGQHTFVMTVTLDDTPAPHPSPPTPDSA